MNIEREVFILFSIEKKDKTFVLKNKKSQKFSDEKFRRRRRRRRRR